jgi:hypothetical protein
MNGIARRLFRGPWTNLLWLTAATAIAGDWPAFRGPAGNGIVTTVFRPNPEKFELLAMNDLREPSHATPAVSDGQIFLRTHTHLYCISEDSAQ